MPIKHIQEETKSLLYKLTKTSGDHDTRVIPGYIFRYVDAEFSRTDDAMRRFLSQLIFWTTPSSKLKSGEFVSRMAFEAKGCVWVKKSYKQWSDDCRISRTVLAKKLKILTDSGIIERQSIDLGSKNLLVRFNEDALKYILETYGDFINEESHVKESGNCVEITPNIVKSQNGTLLSTSPKSGLYPSQNGMGKVPNRDFLYTHILKDTYTYTYERMNEKTLEYGRKVLGHLDVESKWGKKYTTAIYEAIEAGGLGYELFQILHIAQADFGLTYDLGKWQNFAYNIHPGKSEEEYRIQLELYLGELALNPKVDIDLRLAVLRLSKYKLKARSSCGTILDDFDLLNILEPNGYYGLTDNLALIMHAHIDGLSLELLPSIGQITEHMKTMVKLESLNENLRGDSSTSKIAALLTELNKTPGHQSVLGNLKYIPENQRLMILDYTVRILRHTVKLDAHLIQFSEEETFARCKFAA